MIKVDHVSRSFGARQAVKDVSFTVEKGTVLGFLGPNGAGKTTTMRIIAGYLAPSEGQVLVCGEAVAANPALTQRKIGYMPENTPLYDDMTVEEFLVFIAEVRGYRGREGRDKAGTVIERCALHSVRNQVIDTLSKGYRRRTSLAQALLHDPEVLLLDEPTEGLDPNQKQVVREMILEMAPEKAIVLSTHVLEEVTAVCTRAVIISGGTLVANSTPRELLQRSPGFNSVRLVVKADPDTARAAFDDLPGVSRVLVLDHDAKRARLLLEPSEGQSIVAQALERASSRKWSVSDVEVDSGHLDAVFRQITTTEDAA